MRPHHISFYLSIKPPNVRNPAEIRGCTIGRSAMSDTSTGNHNGAGWYEIRLKGHLDSRWAAWFDGLSLSRPTRPPEPSRTTAGPP